MVLLPVLFGLGFILSMFLALIGIIHPIPRVGLKTRGTALKLLLISTLFLVGSFVAAVEITPLSLLPFCLILVGSASLIGIIHPIPRLGLKTRTIALGVFLTSLIAAVLLMALAENPFAEAPASSATFSWILLFLLSYGVFRLLCPDLQIERSVNILRMRNSNSNQPSTKIGSAPTPALEPPFQESTVGSHPTEQHISFSKEAPKGVESWIAPGSTFSLAGRDIGGMFYVQFAFPPSDSQSTSRAFIDPTLPVSEIGREYAGYGISYFPHYSELSPTERSTYVDWLAGDRSDQRIGPGYIFLYFYGLERRFFVDAPAEEEKQFLVFEVKRLLDTYGDNHSISSYLEGFLQAAKVVLRSVDEVEPYFERLSYQLPLGLQVAVGKKVKEGLPLGADWLLAWYVSYPNIIVRTATRRAFPEFKALYRQVFAERYPKGLTINTPSRPLLAGYTAASAEFDVDLKHYFGDIPEISSTSELILAAREIADIAATQLDKYSRYLGRNPDGRDTIEAHAHLPQRLWPIFPNTEIEELKGWANGIIGRGEILLLEEILERVEGRLPEKIGRQQFTKAADLLARLSIGLAPDPRFSLRSPKRGEPGILFPLPEGVVNLEEVSTRYKGILIVIALGSYIAHSDGKIAEEERSALEAKVKNAEITESERARLFANLHWMLTIPPDLRLLQKRFEEASQASRHELGLLALAIATADGEVDPGEIREIERIYKALGLPTQGIYSDLHNLSSRDEPVVVRPASGRSQQFAIPPQPKRENTVFLDAEKIATVIDNTAVASSILGAIFREDEDEKNELKVTGNLNDGFLDLDTQLKSILQELMTQQHWTSAEFTTLAERFQLMPEGSLEMLNEWAVKNFDDTLIDEYDGYDLNQEIVEQIAEMEMADAASEDKATRA